MHRSRDHRPHYTLVLPSATERSDWSEWRNLFVGFSTIAGALEGEGGGRPLDSLTPLRYFARSR